MKTVKNNIVIRMIFLLVVMTCSGFLLKAATFIIPVNPMKKNMQKCEEIFTSEGKYHVMNAGYLSTRLDNYTDAIMLLTSMYDDEQKNVFEKVAGSYRLASEGKNPVECLVSFLDDEQLDSETAYAHYWHGYVTILKPIFLFFDYSDVRIFNMIIQSFLVLYLLSLLNKDEYLKKYLLPLIVSLLAINPYTISYSMQYSWIYYIVLGSSIILLKRREFFAESPRELLIFFTIVGALTSFFDLLTWPLATCLIPLTFILIIDKDNWIKEIVCVTKCGLSWCVGYLGMWCGCWATGSLFLKRNVFQEALESILFRTSNNISKDSIHIVTSKEVIRNQLFPLMKWPYAIMLFTVLFICIYKLIKQYRNGRVVSKRTLLGTIPFLLVSIIPFAWFLVSKNHSYLHYTFTYRILVITLFSGLSMIVNLLNHES